MAKPYAPELKFRALSAEKREIRASRPYSPELSARQDHGSIKIVDRSNLNLLETRKTKTCTKQSQCASDEYCNTSSKKCTSQKKNGLSCRGNNYECASEYCSVKTETCRAKGQKGDRCLVDAGCDSGLDCVNKVCTKKRNSTTSTHPSSTSTKSSSTATATKTSSPSGSAKDKRELHLVD